MFALCMFIEVIRVLLVCYLLYCVTSVGTPSKGVNQNFKRPDNAAFLLMQHYLTLEIREKSDLHFQYAYYVQEKS